MCQIESVIHVACRHWGKDRFYGEPCPRARRVRNGALSSCIAPPSRNGSLPVDVATPDYEILPSPCPAYHMPMAPSSSTGFPVYARSKATREARRRTYSTATTSSCSTSTTTRSSISSSSNCSASSNHDTAGAVPAYPYLGRPPPARPLTTKGDGDYYDDDDDVDGSAAAAWNELQPDEYVFLPCLYAEKVGCANGEGPCPRCMPLPLPRMLFTMPFQETRDHGRQSSPSLQQQQQQQSEKGDGEDEEGLVDPLIATGTTSVGRRRYDCHWFVTLADREARKFAMRRLKGSISTEPETGTGREEKTCMEVT